jgi:hypothetical protein
MHKRSKFSSLSQEDQQKIFSRKHLQADGGLDKTIASQFSIKFPAHK